MPAAAREAYSLYVERVAAGTNDADGPFSAASGYEDDLAVVAGLHHRLVAAGGLGER